MCMICVSYHHMFPPKKSWVQVQVKVFLTKVKVYLTKVKVEALEAPISQTDDGELFTDVALGLMFGGFRCRQPVQDGHPDQGLRFELHPRQELGGFYVRFATILLGETSSELYF